MSKKLKKQLRLFRPKLSFLFMIFKLTILYYFFAWSDLKIKLINKGSELYEKVGQLKMQSADGKYYNTDVLDTKGICDNLEKELGKSVITKENNINRRYIEDNENVNQIET